jgi:hypothetical protein
VPATSGQPNTRDARALAGFSATDAARHAPGLLRLAGTLERGPLVAAAVVGGAVLQAALNAAPTAEWVPAVHLAARAALACWIVLTLGSVAGQMLAPAAGPADGALDGRAGRYLVAPAGGAVHAGQLESEHRPFLSAGWITLATLVLLSAALQRAPARLALNAAGYLAVVGPLVWIVGRRAGRLPAARAALACSVLALAVTHVNLPRQTAFDYVMAREESPFRWSVGWPADGWVLRHEIRLPEPAGGRAAQLTVLLAARYDGAAQVFAAVNGRDLGPMRLGADRKGMYVDVPASAIAGATRLRFELRQAPVDPALRIVAQRWSAGATLGGAASSFFDTRTWWPGTFNDVTAQRQPGVYVVELTLR